MARCPICGTTFDAGAYQVLVPGREEAFDRVDCAARAAALAPDLPFLASEEPPAADDDGLVAALFTPLRTRAVLAAASLAVSAAVAAAAYLWLRPEDETRPREPAPLGALSPFERAQPFVGAGDRPQTGERRARAGGERLEERRSGGPSTTVASGGSTAGSRPGGKDGSSPPAAAGGGSPEPSSGPAPSSGLAPSPGPAPVGETDASAPQPSHTAPPPPPPPPPPRPPPPPPRPPPPPAQPASPVGGSLPSRPGWGHGDENHVHTGPPGNGGAAQAPPRGPKP